MAALIAPAVMAAGSLIDAKMPTPVRVKLPGVKSKRRSRRPPKGKAKPSTGRVGKRKAEANGRARASATASNPGNPNSFGGNAADAKQLAAFRAMSDSYIGKLTGGSISGGSVFSNQSRKTRNSVSFDQAHLAQKNVEKSFRNGIRVIVSNVDGAIAAVSIGSLGAYAQGSGAGSSTKPFPASSTTTTSLVNLTPQYIDDKLHLIEDVFEYSACRYLKLRTVPSVGDYTTTSVNTNVSLALGILRDTDEASGSGIYAAPTHKNICDLEIFAENHVSKPMELEYCHTGPELWKTATTGVADADLAIQAKLVGAYDTAIVSGSTSDANYAHMHVFAVWDFYGLRAIEVADEVDGPQKEFKGDSKSHPAVVGPINSRYVSVSNDDVKSLFEETVSEKLPLKRSEPVPIPRPPSSGKGSSAVK